MEMLTTPEVAEQLKGEMQRRENRKENASVQITIRNYDAIVAKRRIYPNLAENIVKSSDDDESKVEGNDDTACLEYKWSLRL